MIGLKLIRRRCNYSIGSFAKLIGVSRQIVSEWELVKKEIPPKRKAEYEPEIEQYIRLQRERKHLLEQMDSAFHGNSKYYNSARDTIKAFYRDITIYNHFLNCYNEIWDESLEKKTHRMLYHDLFSVILDSVFRAYSNAPKLEVEEKDLYGELEPGENPYDILYKQLTNDFTRLIKNTLEDTIHLADHRIKYSTSSKL